MQLFIFKHMSNHGWDRFTALVNLGTVIIAGAAIIIGICQYNRTLKMTRDQYNYQQKQDSINRQQYFKDKDEDRIKDNINDSIANDRHVKTLAIIKQQADNIAYQNEEIKLANMPVIRMSCFLTYRDTSLLIPSSEKVPVTIITLNNVGQLPAEIFKIEVYAIRAYDTLSYHTVIPGIGYLTRGEPLESQFLMQLEFQL